VICTFQHLREKTGTMMRLSALLVLVFGLSGGPALACGTGEVCRIGPEAEYRVSPPPGWDGQAPIGAFLFFHGHRSSAAEMAAYKELTEAVHALGFLFVAPQGLQESWSTPGSPGEGRRDELIYTTALLDDLIRRFPINPTRIVASGFSQGASVVWEIACRGDARFTAFMPVAGVWWRPMPQSCAAAPKPLLHIHGTADSVMPMTGRNLRDRWKQGDVREAFATLKRGHFCPVESSLQEQRGALRCSFSEQCGSGKSLALCLHDGDHHTNPAWFMAVKDWLGRVLPP
jgi:polyhydroxybutyrate depolymerase